jgi:hypothetical protein
MKILELEFDKSESKCVQLKRTDKVAIYARYNKEHILTSYEVFIINIREPYELNGYEYPKSEVFPANEVFGKTAWSWGPGQKDKAFKQFENLVNGVDELAPQEISYKGFVILYNPKSGSVRIFKDGKPFSKAKAVLSAYYIETKGASIDEVNSLTYKEIITKVFEN